MAAIPQSLLSNRSGESRARNSSGELFLRADTAVRFQRFHQANALRSQIDDVAKASTSAFPSTDLLKLPTSRRIIKGHPFEVGFRSEEHTSELQSLRHLV